MLLDSAAKMNRKAIALAIVMLLAGLAPAAAIIGFCTRMPCCSHAPSHPEAAFSTERGGCCSAITCYDAPSAKLTKRTASADAALASPVIVGSCGRAAARPYVACERIDPSPPRSSLSVLRI